MTATRLERDPLGEKPVPADALYGIQTLRAAENFPISGLRPLPAFVDAVVWIKRSAALTHKETGRLETRLADVADQLDTPITLNVNGCPNSCARIQVADIGLKGQIVKDQDGFQVHLGGGVGLDAGFGHAVGGLQQ